MLVDFEEWVLEQFEAGIYTKEYLTSLPNCTVELGRVWERFCEDSDIVEDCRVEMKYLLRKLDYDYSE
jgi:hypothetical protein